MPFSTIEKIEYNRIFKVIIKDNKLYYWEGDKDGGENPKFKIFEEEPKSWCSISRKSGNRLLKESDEETAIERTKEKFHLFCSRKSNGNSGYYKSVGEANQEETIIFKKFVEIEVDEKSGKWVEKSKENN